MAEFFNAASARETVDWVNAQPGRDSWTAAQWAGVANALGADLDGALKAIERLQEQVKARQGDAEFWTHQARILRGLLNRLRYGPGPDADDFAETKYLSSVRSDDLIGVLIEAAARRYDRAVKDRA